MSGSVQELTGTLLSAIDQEGNVKDMSVVLSVVKMLETTTVTAEDLKVTRLGKFINLIRRKVSEVDKRLSKRLKNMVKQWQQLVQVPNGVVVPPPPTPPTQATPSIPSSSSSSSSFSSSQATFNTTSPSPSLSKSALVGNGSHASPSPHATPSPSDAQAVVPMNNSPSVGSLQFGETSLPPRHSHLVPPDAGSTSSRNSHHTTSSRPSSRGPPSRSRTPTPSAPPMATPSSTTHASRPPQPVSETPAAHRSKILQKLSSVKKSQGQGSAQREEVPVNNQHQGASSEVLPSLPSRQTSSVESVDDGPIGFGGDLNFVDDEMSKSLWTSDSFTDMAMEDFGVGGSPWGQSAVAAAVDSSGGQLPGSSLVYNGVRGGRDPVHSRKRPHPESPQGSERAASQPAHKRYKSRKNRAKSEAGPLKCVVRIPLDKIFLNHSHVVFPGGTGSEGVGSQPREGAVVSADDAELAGGLIVSIRRALLSRIPTVGSIGLECHPKAERTNRHRRNHQSHDQSRQSHGQSRQSRGQGRQSHGQGRQSHGQGRQSHDQSRHSPHDQGQHSHDQDQQSHDWHMQSDDLNSQPLIDLPDLPDIFDPSRLPPIPTRPDTPINNDALTTARDSSTVPPSPLPALPIREPRPPPEGVSPGVDGCLGQDGYWYEWTEHIGSHGEEVTILPYIYIEDS